MASVALHAWQIPGGSGSSPALGSDGTIYLGSWDNTVYALNPNGTTQHIWTVDDYVWASPAIATNGTIYVGSGGSNFYAFNPDGTTQHIWTITNSIGFDSSPAIGSNGTIYVGNWNGSLYAFNPDGTTQHVWCAGLWLFASPAIGPDGTIYTADDHAGNVFAFNPDGTTQHVWTMTGGSESSPAIGADGTIYIGTWGDFYAFNPDGTTQHVWSTQYGFDSPPVIGPGGTIYISDYSDSFYAFNPDGTTQHVWTTEGVDYSAAAIASDGTIYHGSWSHLVALNPDNTTQQFWSIGGGTECSPTISSNGNVYFMGDDDFLYEIKTGSGPLANTPWPKFHADPRNTGNLKTSAAPPPTPSIPSDLIASDGLDPGAITLSWSSAQHATGYEIFRSLTNDIDTATCLTRRTDGTTYCDYTVTPYAACYYWVRSTTVVATSDFSVADSGWLALPTPITVSASDGTLSDSIRLLWNMDTTSILYRIWRNTNNNSASFAYIGDCSTNIYDDYTASPGVIYYYWIQEMSNPSSHGLSAPDYGSRAFVGAPASPSNVAASYRLYSDKIIITWDPITNAVGYTVWSNTKDDILSARLLHSSITSNLYYEDCAIVRDTPYYYWITATNEFGSSCFSDPAAIGMASLVRHEWTIVGGSASTPAIAADGTLYIGSWSNRIYALNPNGATQHIWLVDSYVRASPAIGSNGTIYVGSGAGSFYALNPDGTTQRVWRLPYGIESSAAIGEDGSIYVGDCYRTLYALNPNGTTQRMWATSGKILSSPAIGSDNTIYVGDQSGRFYAFNPDGTTHCIWKTSSKFDSSPAIDDGTIYIADANRQLYAFRPDGTTQHVWKTIGSVSGSPVIGSNGIIYIGDQLSYFYAFYPDGTTQHVWRMSAGAYYSTPAIASNGAIYMCDWNGGLYAFNPNGTTQQTWSYIGYYANSSLTIGHDGTLYYADQWRDHLYAITASNGPVASTPWPKFRHDLYNVGAIGTSVAASLPSVPTNLSASDGTYTNLVILNWNSGAHARYYKLYRNLTNNLYSATLLSSQIVGTIYRDYAATQQTMYYYWLQSINSVGTSDFCAVDSGWPAMPSPTNICASDGTFLDKIRVSWSCANTSSIYRVLRNTNNISTSATYIGTSTATEYDDNMASPGIWYYYWVQASNMPFISMLSTSDFGYRAFVSSLAPPSNVNASYRTYTDKIQITWNPVTNATGYTIWYSTKNEAASARQIDQIVITNTMYDDFGRTLDMPYYYWIKAISTNDSSWFSDPAAVGMASLVRHEWSISGGSESTPAIGTNGTLYLGSWNNRVYALNPNGTTQHIWVVDAFVRASPAIGPDGTIYVGSGGGRFYALNPDGTTQRVWRLPYGIEASAAIGTNGTIYVGDCSNTVYALNPNGTTQCTWFVSSKIFSSPAIGVDGTIYVGDQSGHAYALHPNGGTQHVWNTSAGIDSSPAIGADGTVYIADRNKSLYSFSPDGATQHIWQTASRCTGSPVIGTNGTIYIGDEGRYFYAFNPNGTTQHVWKMIYGAHYSTPAIASNGTIYMCDYSCTVYAFNPNGTTQAIWYLGDYAESSLTIGQDGTLYYVDQWADRVYAIAATNGPLANTAWPKFRRDLRQSGCKPSVQVEISSGHPNPTRHTPIGVSISYSSPVAAFSPDALVVSNSSVQNFATNSADAYSCNLIPLAEGLVTIDIPAYVVFDAAGNGNRAAPQFSRVYDCTAPSVALCSTSSAYVRHGTIPVTVTFSEPVAGFDATDIAASNGSVLNFTSVSASNYTFDILPAQGTVTVLIPAGAVADAAGNSNVASAPISRVFDSVTPSLTLTSASCDPTRASIIPVAIAVTEPVTGLDGTDINASNASVANFAMSDDTHYTFDLIPIGQGMVSATLPEGACIDAAGNSTTNSATLTRLYDTVAPTITLASSVPLATKQVTIPVTAMLTEAVSGFTQTDLTISNASAANFTAIDATHYAFDLQPSGQGAVTVAVAADAMQDAAGNGNNAAGPLIRTFDTLPPMPDPSTWQVQPTALNTSSLWMQATDAADVHGPVTYLFTNATLSACSAWQGAPAWTNIALQPNTRHGFRFKTRDTLSNETAWSSDNYCYTHAQTPFAPIAVAIGPDRVRVLLNNASTDTNGPFNDDGNPSSTHYTLAVRTNAAAPYYLTLTGNMSTNIVWGTYADWGGPNGVLVTNLDFMVTNTFFARARNADGIWTDPSPSTNASFAPRVHITAAAQTNDGSGWVYVTAVVHNPRTNACQLRVAYGVGTAENHALSNTAWLAPASISTAYGGDPDSTNGAFYQLANLPLVNGSNEVRLAWDSRAGGNPLDVSGVSTSLWIGISVYDPLAGATSETATASVGLDNVAPLFAATCLGGAVTNAGPLDFAVRFSEPVTGFDSGDIGLAITGTVGTVESVAGNGADYTVRVTQVSGNGSVGWTLAAAAVRDAAGNSSGGGASPSYRIDTIPPLIAISPPSASLISSGTVTYTVLYSGAEHIALDEQALLLQRTGTANASVTASGSDASRSITLSGITGDGTLNVYIAPHTARDAAGNQAGAITGATVAVDNTPPTFTLTSASDRPINAPFMAVTIAFSEGVTGFSQDDLTVANAVISNFVALDAMRYACDLYPVEDGDMTVLIAAGSAQDTAGNGNRSAASLTWSVDWSRPVVTIVSSASDPTKDSPLIFSIAFSEAVSGFTASDLIVSNGSVSAYASESESAHRVSVIPATDDIVSVTVPADAAFDSAGNGNTVASTCARRYDGTAPTVTILSTASDPTEETTIPIFIRFSEAVSDFSSGDIAIGGGTLAEFVADGGTQFDCTVIPSAQGLVTVSIATDAAHDAAGNGNVAATRWSSHYRIAVPTQVAASDGLYTDAIRVSWNAVAAANQYEIWRHADAGDDTGDRVESRTAADTVFDDTTAAPGNMYVYWIAAVTPAGTSVLSQADSGWRRSAASTDEAERDMDGDHLLDLALYHTASGYWHTYLSASGQIESRPFGNADCTPVPGDFDADGATDIAVYHEPSGYWYAWLSAPSIIQAQPFGAPGCQPVTGDYDGDGQTDRAVYHPSSGYWYIQRSASDTLMAQWWGAPGCVPVPADYDGDGYTDVAVYHEATGGWYLWLSASDTAAYRQWGATGCAPVVCDYDADHKADVAVYQAASGYWFALLSDGATVFSTQWGAPDFTPVPGDYDDDTITDLAVYHEATGYWFIRRSASQTMATVSFGGPGYEPIGGQAK